MLGKIKPLGKTKKDSGLVVKPKPKTKKKNKRRGFHRFKHQTSPAQELTEKKRKGPSKKMKKNSNYSTIFGYELEVVVHL